MKNKPYSNVSVFATLITVVVCLCLIDALHLTGVTLVPKHPRSEVYVSFFHELIAEIGEISQFTHQLRELPSGEYGGQVGESLPSGLIGEIYNNNADFLIADMEITPERKKFIQFTRPFMKAKLAALVARRKQKSHDGNQATKTNNNEEMMVKGENSTNSQAKTNHHHHSNKNRSLYDVLRENQRMVIADSLVERYFQTSKNPLVYHLIPSSIKSLSNGVSIVKTEPNFALISDSSRLSLIAATECDLKVINMSPSSTNNQTTVTEQLDDFEAEYAIGLRINSPFYAHFENALKFLQDTGRLELLINQFWSDQYCQKKRSQQNQDEEETMELMENDAELNSAEFMRPAQPISSLLSFFLFGLTFIICFVV